MKRKPNLVKVRDVLPAAAGDLISSQPIPLENEAPHRKLARLTREHSETTAALQELKRSWAERNVKAQACRQAISTPEITHFEEQKRTLALRLLDLQTQIGATNKELREQKAERQGNGSKVVELKKKCPLKNHAAFATYFLLAARDVLPPGLYDQTERGAKALLQHALATGVEES